MSMQKNRKYKRLTWENRVQIETLYNIGTPVRVIAEKLGFHISSIYYELKHGYYMHRNTDWTETKRYSAYKAHQKMLFERTTKGAQLKIGKDYKLLKYIEDKIITEKKSPEIVLGEIKKNNITFDTSICVSTLYSYIDKGVFLNVTNKNLLIKGKKKKQKKVRVAKTCTKGKSIEERPKNVNHRNEFGHWELDTVIGKKNKDEVLFVFTERMTRKEIIIKAKDKSILSCLQVLNKLERKYRTSFKQIFKTITCDNGCEFQNWLAMETSCLYKNKRRTQIYYCHAYASCERGSNENQNRFIRRFIPKGTPISNYSNTKIHDIEEFINNYPRKIFNYRSSNELFEEELNKLTS